MLVCPGGQAKAGADAATIKVVAKYAARARLKAHFNACIPLIVQQAGWR
jgi:hypothetical protein